MASSALLREANQFLVPARGYREGTLQPAQYDYRLAADHLNRFRLALPDPRLRARFERPGPFLIATVRPVGEIVRIGAQGDVSVDAASVALLLDLNDAHPKAIPAYVNAFKAAVRATLPVQFTDLQPLRAAFASGVIKLGEALPFVAEAYAGTVKVFDPAGPSGARP